MPTLTVVSTDEPVDPGSGYIWSDDFDRYTDVTSMGRDSSCGPSADSVYGVRTLPNTPNGCSPLAKYELVTGRGGSGKALRSNYPNNGSQQNTNWLSPYRASNWAGAYLSVHALYTTQAAIAVSFWFRIQNGWGPGSAGIKWFEMWSSNIPAGGNIAAGGEDRTQTSMDGGNGTTGPLWSMEPAMSGGVNRTKQPIAPYYEDVNDGEWHRFTVYYKPNTSKAVWADPANATSLVTPSSRDGVIRCWIDGTKMLDYSQDNVGVTPSGGTNAWCVQADVDCISNLDIDFLKFPDNLNGLNRGDGWIDTDDLKVWVV
jgi:hypothetical protein